MIHNDKRLISYLNSTVNSVFKILPLYEEDNIGLDAYIDSLLFELSSLDYVFSIEEHKYSSLLLILSSIKREVSRNNSSKAVVKREVFKSISIIKSMIIKLEEID